MSQNVVEPKLGKLATDPQRRMQLFANPAMLTRGVLAIVFGLVVLLWPGLGLGELVTLFACYAVVDGIVAVGWGALTSLRQHEGWPVALEGFFSVVLGVAVLLFPWQAGRFVHEIAAWGVLTGCAEILAATRAPRAAPLVSRGRRHMVALPLAARREPAPRGHGRTGERDRRVRTGLRGPRLHRGLQQRLPRGYARGVSMALIRQLKADDAAPAALAPEQAAGARRRDDDLAGTL